MKNLLIISALMASGSLLATSPMHPVAYSINSLTTVLKDAEVQKQLFKRTDNIESVTYEKSLDSEMGWVIRTAHCTLETRIERKLIKKIPHHPMGGQYKEIVHSGTCK